MAQLLTDEGFEKQIASVFNRAYGVALRLTRNQSNAEDLLQEAILRAYRGRHTFDAGSNFNAWFYRILTNIHNRNYRKQEARPDLLDISEVPELHLYRQLKQNGLTSDSGDPSLAVFDKLATEQFSQAIDDLPDEFRDVVALYFLDELSYQEIAEALDVPLGTVRSRLHRGRNLLQRALWEIAVSSGIISKKEGLE